MELRNEFEVPAGIDETWAALNDVSRVAPCFPGSTLEEVDGDTFTGSVKVKLGSIQMVYKGKGEFVERDEAAHTVKMNASGRESRGSGTASADVTTSLSGNGDRTTVTVVTDLKITGKVAQFGRGVMNDVADKLLGQFSSCLAEKLS